VRAHTPGGRFDADYETTDLLKGIDSDLKHSVGTKALWYIFDSVNSDVDPLYDVGQDISSSTGGKVWTGPFSVPVVRAVIKQGEARTSAVGYYNSDTLHLTFNIEDVQKFAPNIIIRPDINNRDRVVWRGQVYRPFAIQERGIVADRFTILSVDCIQLMPEEMVNDPQFYMYSSAGDVLLNYGYGNYGDGNYGN
jgi:hypothetical protein